MGLRDRIKSRLSRTLKGAATEPTRPTAFEPGREPQPSSASAPPTAPQPPKPPAVVAPRGSAPAPPPNAASIGVPPTTSASASVPPPPDAPPVAQPEALPEMRPEALLESMPEAPRASPPGSPPAAQAAPAAATPATAVGLSQLLESDYASDDAPVRNAHYADVFETTEQAMAVHVYAESEGVDVTFMVEPGEYILDAAERAGHELPFSCRSGGCLSCSAMLESGDCEMEEQYVLEDEHITQGYRLLCLTTVTSPCTFETHVQDDIE